MTINANSHHFQTATKHTNMVYEWAPHKEVCYRLYVEEKRTLEDIVEYMREHHSFAPR